MRHIVSFSGGKDSTAMLLMMLKLKMPIDAVVFVDLGHEHDEIYAHIDQVEKRTGLDVVRTDLAAEFMQNLFVVDIVKGKRVGQRGYGWPSIKIRWCTGMKVAAIQLYARTLYPGEQATHYIGIASDEAKRMINAGPNTKAPLIDLHVTEAYALKYCRQNGYDFGGHYNRFNRASCWLCPIQPMDELYALYHHRRELWEQLKALDLRSPRRFPVDLAEVEERFRRYEQGDAPRFMRSRCNNCIDEFVTIGRR